MSWYKPWTWGDESESATQKRGELNTQGRAASGFAGLSQSNVGELGNEARDARGMLRDQATGKTSLSAEQLRQGLQQLYSTQRSMAAGASSANAPMAARTAAINAGRAGVGMSGQAAMAGIAEQQAAAKALQDAILQQRAQDMNAALGSRQNAISAYGGVTPEGSFLDKWGNAIVGGASVIAKSDKRAKTDIADGDAKAAKVLRGLKAYTYKYKDERDGKGTQFGPMAQELEKAGLEHAVIDTPRGKYVDGGKAALSSIGLTAALAKRVEKLEKERAA